MKPALLLCLLMPFTALSAQKLSIAGASNLVYALDSLNAAFRKTSPQVELTVATGASGSLVAQIQNGAPFDLFLSADAEYPRQLVQAGAAVEQTLTPFAVGRLVLWTVDPELPWGSIAEIVRSRQVTRIAIANVDTAPYGAAAREALHRLKLWDDAQPKLVAGENITQTAQFVETGNAQIGFVAMSLILSPKLKDKGRWQEIPAGLHAEIQQVAVLTNRGAKNPAATRYLEFLRGLEAREVLERFGYRIP